MKTAILILFLVAGVSFKQSPEAHIKYIKISDKLDIYRIRDRHNLNEFDKKVNALLVTNTAE